MLVKHSSNMYSWGENGKVFVGAKARLQALVNGVAIAGEKEFRKAASKSGVTMHGIELAIVEYRAKGDDTYRGTTRDGTQESEDNAGDINETVASQSGGEEAADEINDSATASIDNLE